MEYQTFIDIKRKFSLGDQNLAQVLGDGIEPNQVQRYIAGTEPITAPMAERLLHLSKVFDWLAYQALREFVDREYKPIYWPVYESEEAFRLAPDCHATFLGCWAVHRAALKNAHWLNAFHLWQNPETPSWRLIGRIWRAGKTFAIRTYPLTAKTYLPWLTQNRYRNSLQRRREHAQWCWEQFMLTTSDQTVNSNRQSYCPQERARETARRMELLAKICKSDQPSELPQHLARQLQQKLAQQEQREVPQNLVQLLTLELSSCSRQRQSSNSSSVTGKKPLPTTPAQRLRSLMRQLDPNFGPQIVPPNDSS